MNYSDHYRSYGAWNLAHTICTGSCRHSHRKPMSCSLHGKPRNLYTSRADDPRRLGLDSIPHHRLDYMSKEKRITCLIRFLGTSLVYHSLPYPPSRSLPPIWHRLSSFDLDYRRNYHCHVGYDSGLFSYDEPKLPLKPQTFAAQLVYLCDSALRCVHGFGGFGYKRVGKRVKECVIQSYIGASKLNVDFEHGWSLKRDIVRFTFISSNSRLHVFCTWMPGMFQTFDLKLFSYLFIIIELGGPERQAAVHRYLTKRLILTLYCSVNIQ